MSEELEEGLLIAEEQRLRVALAGLCELPLRRPAPPVPPQELTVEEFFEVFDDLDQPPRAPDQPARARATARTLPADESPASPPAAPRAKPANGFSSSPVLSTETPRLDDSLATGEFLSAFNWE
jgi:hypothetical protein